jgi:hypothetical protein
MINGAGPNSARVHPAAYVLLVYASLPTVRKVIGRGSLDARIGKYSTAASSRSGLCQQSLTLKPPSIVRTAIQRGPLSVARGVCRPVHVHHRSHLLFTGLTNRRSWRWQVEDMVGDAEYKGSGRHPPLVG